MRSNSPNSPALDIDLGMFEDVLVGAGTATATPRPRGRQVRPAPVAETPPEPAVERPRPPSAIVLRPEIVTLAAGVEFVTLQRGLYTLTIAGYSNELANLPPQPFPAVDVVLAPNEVADAATVMSPFVNLPPWPYDRDVVLIAKVLADSARFCVITYRRDEVTPSPMLRIEKISPESTAA